MIASLLRLTGLEQKLDELKRDLQLRADSALDRLKGMAVQIAVAAGLVVGAALFGLLAILTGLVAFYLWAESEWGPFAALGMIGGALALLALALLWAGLYAVRGKEDAAQEPSADIAEIHAREAHAKATTMTSLPAPKSASAGARPDPEILRAELPAGVVEPFLSLVGRYARTPRTGLEPIDDLLRQMQPHAHVATDDAIKRAAFLVQTGDRTTMVAILGAAAALGWLMVRSTGEREAGT